MSLRSLHILTLSITFFLSSCHHDKPKTELEKKKEQIERGELERVWPKDTSKAQEGLVVLKKKIEGKPYELILCWIYIIDEAQIFIDSALEKPTSGDKRDIEKEIEIPGEKFIHAQWDELTREQVPPELYEPLPLPETEDDVNDELKEKLKKRLEQEREARRNVIVTTKGEAPNITTIVRVFDGRGKLINQFELKGKFERSHVNKTMGEKVFTSIPWKEKEFEKGKELVVIDLKTGKTKARTRFILPEDIKWQDLEIVAGRVVVIYQENQVARVALILPDGRLQDFYFVPGNFHTALAKGNLKAIITYDPNDNKSYIELIDVAGEIRLPAPGGLAINPITGTPEHIQYDEYDGKKRFVGVVYNRARNETIIRIINESGIVVRKQVIPGKFQDMLAIQRPAGVTKALRKVILIDNRPAADAHILDLDDGKIVKIESIVGKPTGLSARSNGQAEVRYKTGSEKKKLTLDVYRW